MDAFGEKTNTEEFITNRIDAIDTANVLLIIKQHIMISAEYNNNNKP